MKTRFGIIYILIIFLLLFAILITGCGFDLSGYEPPTATQPPPTLTPAPTEVDTSDCFYAKSTNDLPEIANTVMQALETTQPGIVSVTAWGEGQNYVCPTAGKSTFSSNQVNLTVTIKAGDLENDDSLGRLAGKVLDALINLPDSIAPGWQQGQTRFIFKQNDQSREITFQGAYAITDRQQGMDGDQFWQALNQQPCTNQASSDPQPDLSAALQTILDNSGIKNARVNAIVNGISCVDQNSGSLSNYRVQNTQLGISFQVNDLDNHADLGNLAQQAINAISQMPPETIPGSQPATIKFTFQSGDQQINSTIDLNSALDAQKRGLKGNDLYDILNISQ
jgi:hypothetical protein